MKSPLNPLLQRTLGIMKRRCLCPVLLAFILSAEISAAPRMCAEQVGAPYTGFVPSNLRLLPPCPNAEGMESFNSYWVFRGHVTLAGQIRSESWPDGGQVAFEPSAATRSQLPSTVKSVQLDDETGNSALGVPKTNLSASSCFLAQARIEFVELTVISDETDRSGKWVNQYKIVFLGKWKKC